MNVPFVDLKAQYAGIRPEIDAAVRGVLERCDFILGGAVGEFEKAFAAFVGTKHCVSVANGTDALHLALRALGVGPGDEVLLPPNTFIATAVAVSEVGGIPVFVDVRPDTFNIDPSLIEGSVTERTKAIIPVHLFGQPALMAEIAPIAAEHGLAVVEDACQAHGASIGGRRCGSMGAAGCFSFYPGKNLGAYGDGGAVTTNDGSLDERLRLLRNYGQRVKNVHDVPGVNSRLDTIQAAILNVKLGHLADWSRARARNAALYEEALAGIAEVQPPPFDRSAEFGHVFHLYVVRAQRRDDLSAFLHERGVSCGLHYPTPIHLMPAYRHLGYKAGDFPVAERAAQEIISLPMFAELTEGQIRCVADAIREFYRR
ncbi:MAG: DegT/DnrJ/EryC1/StrS family aminotransferase [Lentisphaerae bacterium]|nr:DegT/DnrJ/EryC1/StrS family aminotransferase [Lentisphaerota bacterium]